MRDTAIILICFMLLASCQRKAEEQNTPIEAIPDHPKKERKTPEEHCYLKVTGKDSIKVNFTISGDSITGIYHNLPYGIDKRISVFKGTLRNNHGIAISKYSAEGNDYIEEIQFNIDDKTLKLKFGPTEQGKDGIWRQKTGEEISEHVLPKVHCEIYED